MNKKNYSIILFDLDGTITDSGEGVTNSVMYALGKYGIEVENRAELYRFIGPPLIDSFMNYYGFDHEKAVEAVSYYREYYQKTGIWENTVYEGIPELLKKMNDCGKRVLVATSKPEHFARLILEKHDIAKYFEFIAGASMDESRSQKDEVIQYALESCNITRMSDVVMVGDTKFDIIGANKFGMDSVGVLFGYGTEEELKKEGATYICENAEEIWNILA